MQQAKHLMDSSTELLDKRIVSKLLLTYFEREQSPDVLELMARMLNMSEDEKSKMGLGERAAAKPGSDSVGGHSARAGGVRRSRFRGDGGKDGAADAGARGEGAHSGGGETDRGGPVGRVFAVPDGRGRRGRDRRQEVQSAANRSPGHAGTLVIKRRVE